MKAYSKIVLISTLVSCFACTEEKKPELKSFNQEELRQVLPLSDQPSAPAKEVATEPANTPVQASGQEGVILNPPHGQPGHDCAVQEGAPLPSKSSVSPAAATPAPAPAPITAQPAAPVQLNTAPASSGGQRLNPAHGQPGHDCAVAVGAPLN